MLIDLGTGAFIVTLFSCILLYAAVLGCVHLLCMHMYMYIHVHMYL